MLHFFEKIKNDVRFIDGLNACMNCGVCTASCPAAEFYNFDPRQICNILLEKDEEKIEELLKTDTIWYCGQCMSCKARCPRGNVPALLIAVLRKVSQETGLFVESEKGRQQYAIKKTIGENIINTGYCVHVDHVNPKLHPEQGPIWKWFTENAEDVADRLGANYNKVGPGALRKIPKENIDEIKKIFNITGGTAFLEKIDNFSKDKAKKLHINFVEELLNNEYFFHVFIQNSNKHNK